MSNLYLFNVGHVYFGGFAFSRSMFAQSVTSPSHQPHTEDTQRHHRRTRKAAVNLEFNQEPDQICWNQLHTRRTRPFVTYIWPQTNKIPHNLAIPPLQKPWLFTPVHNTLPYRETEWTWQAIDKTTFLAEIKKKYRSYLLTMATSHS